MSLGCGKAVTGFSADPTTHPPTDCHSSQQPRHRWERTQRQKHLLVLLRNVSKLFPDVFARWRGEAGDALGPTVPVPWLLSRCHCPNLSTCQALAFSDILTDVTEMQIANSFQHTYIWSFFSHIGFTAFTVCGFTDLCTQWIY